MESIYNPEVYVSSEHLNVRQYFKEYSEICRLNSKKSGSTLTDVTDIETLSLIKDEVNCFTLPETYLEIDQIKKLELECSIDKLKCSDENEPLPIPIKHQTKAKVAAVYPIDESAEHLEVIQRKEILDEAISLQKVDMATNHSLSKILLINNNDTAWQDLKPGEDFIYSINIYKPTLLKHKYDNMTRDKKFNRLVYSHEIEVLGRNTLSDLATKINCVADSVIYKEVPNMDVDFNLLINASEIYPSRFFFIDDVFYNYVGANSLDYSGPIIEWAKQKNIGKLSTAPMDQAVINTLKPRLGYPYVFVHQGECEHIVVFTDARLIQDNDCLYSKMYPRISKANRCINIMCFLCLVVHAKWICTECDRFPQEKVFLCSECCKSYNFNSEGEKIGQFKLYPYRPDEILRNMGFTL